MSCSIMARKDRTEEAAEEAAEEEEEEIETIRGERKEARRRRASAITRISLMDDGKKKKTTLTVSSDVRNSWEDETVCWMRVFLKTFSSGPRTRTFLFGFDHGDFIKLFNFQDKASKKPNTGQTPRKKFAF